MMKNNNSNLNQDKDYNFKNKMVERARDRRKRECRVLSARRVLESKVPTYQNQMLIIPLN